MRDVDDEIADFFFGFTFGSGYRSAAARRICTAEAVVDVDVDVVDVVETDAFVDVDVVDVDVEVEVVETEAALETAVVEVDVVVEVVEAVGMSDGTSLLKARRTCTKQRLRSRAS